MTTELQHKREQELSDWERDAVAWNLPRPVSAGRPPTDASENPKSKSAQKERESELRAGRTSA
jgi:hypothetical protein